MIIDLLLVLLEKNDSLWLLEASLRQYMVVYSLCDDCQFQNLTNNALQGYILDMSNVVLNIGFGHRGKACSAKSHWPALANSLRLHLYWPTA